MGRNFTGTGSKAEFSGAVITAPPITMACWGFFSTLPSATQFLMSVSLGPSGASNSSFGLDIRGGVAGKPLGAFWDNAASQATAGSLTGPSVNTWFHGAAVFASTSSRTCYFNGVPGTPDTTSIATPTGLTTTNLGGIYFTGATPTDVLNGTMAEAAIWSAALTDAEIAALATGINVRRIRPGSLVAYWPLWGLQNPEPDLSGNKRSMTVTSVGAARHAPVTLWTRKPPIAYGLPTGPASFTIAETSLPSNHDTGTVVIHANGSGTTWTGSETVTVPVKPTGWALSSATFVDSTHYTVTLTCPAAATPPLGATGTLTVQIDALSANTTVATPTISAVPTSSDTSTSSATYTFTGTHTLWTTETPATLLTLSGGTGASLGTPTVTGNTSATASLTVGTAPGTLTITDNSTGAQATVTVNAPTLVCGPTCSVSTTTARVSFRASEICNVQVKYSTNPDLSGGTTTGSVSVDSSTDFTGKIDISGLTANTVYSYTILLDGVDQLAVTYPTFQTFPSAPAPFSFVFGSCTAHTTASGTTTDDTVFAQIPAATRFLLHLGDTVYADSDTPLNSSTLAQYRQHHQDAMSGSPSFFADHWQTTRRKWPVFINWDDHELLNDFSAGTGDPHYAPAKQAFQEYHGRANPDPLTTNELYYTFNYGDVGFFVCDLRSFRSPNSSTDNASKTILGSTQKTALKNWLLSNNGTYKLKFIVSSVPASGYAANTAGDSWGGIDDGLQTPSGSNGFRTERNEIWDYIDTNMISGVVWLAGDQHWAGSFKTTYGTVHGPRPRYEFLATPYNMIMLTPDSRAADPVNGPIFWKYGTGNNFGYVSVDTTVSPATVSFQLYSPAGSLGSSFLTTITANDINQGLVPSTAYRKTRSHAGTRTGSRQAGRV